MEVIQQSTEYLAKRELDSPRLQIELLLAHVLRVPRLRLYLDFARVLTPAELDAVRALLRRRARREPLQHLVGSTSFCGFEIEVNPAVLIPRPETEVLAERAWNFLAENSEKSAGTRRALDWGTGSGALAVSLAVKCPVAEWVAIDVSAAALVVAARNAARHGVAERIRFLESDGFAALPAEDSFDLIVTNPPYIATDEIAMLQPEVRDYDPRQALDGGADGLDFYRRLAGELAPRLRAGGRLMAELGDGQAEAVSEIFRANKWVVEAVVADYSGRSRVLIAKGFAGR